MCNLDVCKGLNWVTGQSLSSQSFYKNNNSKKSYEGFCVILICIKDTIGEQGFPIYSEI